MEAAHGRKRRTSQACGLVNGGIVVSAGASSIDEYLDRQRLRKRDDDRAPVWFCTLPDLTSGGTSRRLAHALRVAIFGLWVE
jgi:hypothetical protein